MGPELQLSWGHSETPEQSDASLPHPTRVLGPSSSTSLSCTEVPGEPTAAPPPRWQRGSRRPPKDVTPAASPASSQFLTQIRNPFPPSFAPVPLPKISAQTVQGLCSLSPPPGGLSRPLRSAAAPCHAPSLQRPCHQQTSSCAFRIHPEAHPLSSSSVTPPPTSAPLAFGAGSFSGYSAASQASLCPWDSKTIPPLLRQKKYLHIPPNVSRGGSITPRGEPLL